MAGKPQLSEETRNGILSDLRKELSFNAIRDKVGVSLQTIHAIAKANGIERKVGVPKRKEYKARITSHVPLTHTRNGESFLMEAF